MKPLILLFTALAAAAFAQSPKPAAKASPQLPAGVRIERDIAYIEGGDEAQKLDLYLPEQASEKPLPLIVHIHGGGWRTGYTHQPA